MMYVEQSQLESLYETWEQEKKRLLQDLRTLDETLTAASKLEPNFARRRQLLARFFCRLHEFRPKVEKFCFNTIIGHRYVYEHKQINSCLDRFHEDICNDFGSNHQLSELLRTVFPIIYREIHAITIRPAVESVESVAPPGPAS